MSNGLSGADEGDFLELLIANERVLEWVDQLQSPGNPARKKEIIMQLKELVDSKHSYAEEATHAGVVPVLTRILTTTSDEEVMDAISHIMVACSGPMASGGKVSAYTYGPVTVHIREGALGDGLGARVWTVAHIMCKELVAHAGFVAGHDVLEIGAGCGVCGVAAAKLGARKVVLTDVEGPVLRNLRDCVMLNTPSPTPTDSATRAVQGMAALHVCQPELNTQQPSPEQTVPPSSVGEQQTQPAAGDGEHLAGGCPPVQLQPSSPATAQRPTLGATSPADAWASGSMHVRKLDWLESLNYMRARQPCTPTGSMQTEHLQQNTDAASSQATDTQPTSGCTAHVLGHKEESRQADSYHLPSVTNHWHAPGDLDSSTFYANDLLRMADDRNLPGEIPPCVPTHERYSRIIGTDIMYEPMHAALVAAVLAHRLAPGGAALLCCAVRQARTFAAFTTECERWGLRYRKRKVQPATEYGGILGREEDYEGGFLIMAVDHASSACDSWHRQDWE